MSHARNCPYNFTMNILLSNDDGFNAPGLQALYDALRSLADVNVTVIAPEHNNSAKSNSLTLNAPFMCMRLAMASDT